MANTKYDQNLFFRYPTWFYFVLPCIVHYFFLLKNLHLLIPSLHNHRGIKSLTQNVTTGLIIYHFYNRKINNFFEDVTQLNYNRTDLPLIRVCENRWGRTKPPIIHVSHTVFKSSVSTETFELVWHSWTKHESIKNFCTFWSFDNSRALSRYWFLRIWQITCFKRVS